MKQTAHIIAAFACFLAGPALASGQEWRSSPASDILPSTGYVSTTWGPDEGLPSAETGPILQDRTGYVWVGTGFGIVRFDGIAFRTYSSATTPLFRGQQVTAIHEDARGRIWIGLLSGGLVIYDRGHFSSPVFADTIAYESVHGIFADSAGNTYLCTSLGTFVERDGKATLLPGLPEQPRAGFTAPDGTVYFNALSLVRYDAQNDTGVTIVPGAGEVHALADIILEKDHRFLASRLGQIQRYRMNPDGPASLEETFRTPGALRLLRDGDEGYFVGTIGYGVIYFDGKHFSYPHGLGVRRGAGRQTHALMRGAEGSLWATTSGGLYRFSRTFFTILGTDAGLTTEYSWLVHLQKRGVLWIGVGTEGTYRYEGTTARLMKQKDGMPSDHITELFESSDGTMWFGGPNGELGSSTAGGGIRHYPAVATSGLGRVQSISEDFDHRIWIGTRKGFYTFERGKASPFILANGESVPGVRCVTHMPDGSIWCISSGNVVHIREGVLRSYWTRSGSGLYGTTAMMVDTGRVWYGTYGGGLYLIDGDSVIDVNAVCPGFGPRILAIHEDRLGYLWINAERELQRVRKADLLAAVAGNGRHVVIDSFDHRDGLRDIEFNMASEHSAQQLPDGRILYASTSGVVAVNPAAVSRPTTPPPVVIEHVIADDIPYDAGEHIVLPAGTYRIQIDFSALRFQTPGRVMFRYRLVGIDKDWISRPGSQSVATYTNAGPGELAFNLAASVNGGPWTDPPAVMRITVRRFFYEEPALQAVGVLALMSAVIGAFLWRTRRVRERNRQLEEEVQRRIEAESRIQSSLDEKTVMLKEIHHRVKNNLQIVSSLFSLQLGNSRDPMVLEMLKESQTRIRSMALVHEALYRSNNLAAIDFREYVQALAAQIAHTHHRKNIGLRFLGESITLSLDQAIPAGLIMNEALSNAYKHAFPNGEQGTITVESRSENGTHAELAVSDTGPGLPEGFDPATVSSLGFHLILALTEQLSGTLTVDGKPGTTIRIRFPVE